MEIFGADRHRSSLQLAILAYIKQCERGTNTKIARALKTHRESVFRVTKALTEEGLLLKDGYSYQLTQQGQEHAVIASSELHDRLTKSIDHTGRLLELYFFQGDRAEASSQVL